MNERQKLEQAIAAQESLRATLGDAIVDTTIAALRQQLAELAPTPIIRQEYRQATIVVLDLPGLPLDEETEKGLEYRNLVWPWLDGIITPYGGRIDRYIDKATLIVWGIESVQEDYAEQAIRALLAVRNRLSELAKRLDRENSLQMRAGINTGEVLLTEKEDEDGNMVVGDTIHLASRLQKIAPLSTILISHNTYRRVRGVFQVQEHTLLPQKHMRPMQTYQVEAVKPLSFRTRSRGIQGIETRMIGRDAEHTLLQNAFTKARDAHQATLVTISGDTGLGKSRLLYEFDNWLELLQDEIWYFKGRGSLQQQGSAFALIRDLLAFRFEISVTDPVPTMREKFEQGMTTFLGEDSQRQAHLIGAWLGFNFDHSPHLQTIHEPAHLAYWGFMYFLDMLQYALDDGPSIILLEDIHWADQASLDIITQLLQRCPQTPLLIVTTAQPNFLKQNPSWGDRHVRLQLRPLSPQASYRLVEEVLQKALSIPTVLSDLIVTQCKGNPLHMESLIKLMIDKGIIVPGYVQWHIRIDKLQTIEIPDDIFTIILRRLEGLKGTLQDVLELAAVVGRNFWDDAILTNSRQQTIKALNALRKREFVFQRHQTSFSDAIEYIFKHPHLCQVIYQQIEAEQRAQYHAQIAAWWVSTTAETGRADEFAATIGRHYELAGIQRQAVFWYGRAGRKAASQAAYNEAIHFLNRALGLTPADNAHGRYQILLEQEKIYDLQDDRDTQAQTLDALSQLNKHLDDEKRAQIALRQASFAGKLGNYEEAQLSVQKAIAWARTANLPEKVAFGHWLWGHLLWQQWQYLPAIEQLTLAIEIGQTAETPLIIADSLFDLANIASHQAQNEKAKQKFEKALTIYHEQGHREGERQTYNQLGTLAWKHGDLPLAQQYFDQALAVEQGGQDLLMDTILLNNLVLLATLQNQPEKSQQYYQQCQQTIQQLTEQQRDILPPRLMPNLQALIATAT
ncbi:MAG TPA: AAA family ATPase [Anaerolineae bacterium]|nr:AAA family ATPase [Anaerolineae bacterium]